MTAVKLTNFTDALHAHLQANCSRNLALYETTTVSDDELFVAMPAVGEYTGRQAVLEAKRNWFKRCDWRMAANVVWTMELADTAFAVVEVTYSDADRSGLPRDKRFKQMLVFRKDAQQWKAVVEYA